MKILRPNPLVILMTDLRLMAKSLPPLTWFRAFESAARHLSFTAAAEELGVTQSAISQHVRSLEIRFDTILFFRKARGLALTDAGRRLLPDISTAISHIASVANTFEASSPDNVITIATSVSFAQWYLVPKLNEFLTVNPSSSVRIVSTVWPDEFVSTSADAEIRFGAKKQVGKNARRLEPDQLILVASPQLVKPSREGLDWDSLRQYPFIKTVGTSNTWKYWTGKVGVKSEVHGNIYVDSYGMAVDFARRGAGVALTNSLIAAPSLANGELNIVYPQSVKPIDGYFLAINSRGNEDQVQSFAKWLESNVQDIAGKIPKNPK